MSLVAALLALASASVSCKATDGDTLRCGAERVRLLGIDAPEMPGHCRRGRHCAPGDPWASKASLTAMLDEPVALERLGRDVYGRTLAMATTPRGDLACRQLAAGHARYEPRYDRDHLVATRCGWRR